MARRAKEPDLAVDQKEYQITEVLERKRRQLDLDIAEFKAEKENEYRLFERRLRGKTKENGVQDAPQIQRKRGRSESKNAAAEAGSMQREEANHVQRESGGEKASRKGSDPEAENLIDTIRSKSSPGGSPSRPDRPTEVLHEREKEVQGLFTPSYLPLVDNTPTDEGKISKEKPQSLSFNPGNLCAARHNSSAMLSSSAETVPPPMTSPPLLPARPLSSSVPPAKPSHHRSDSFRSDNSFASLRSSLRDPKQPRSPKRVLFSIDDTLVSPSTSPIARRSKSATPKKPADSVDAVGGFEKFEVVRNKNGYGPIVTGSQSNDVDFSSSSAPAKGWAASLSAFDGAAVMDLSKPSPSASGADGFEQLENDDLFTFDEDMGLAGRNRPQAKDPDDEYDEDVEVKSKDPLTASSPHAGSLPIEIKWPGRREDRG